MTDCYLVLTTTDSAAEARKIAETLVDEGLVAGVNIIPGVESIYFWRGKRRHDKEWQLLMQTRAARLANLKQRLVQLHSYANPECMIFRIDDGLPAYLDWIKQNA
ncbi:MAG: divalent-cation tolerance protein CutA [Deltaproteobacteria bacterium]|nr:divalent-cation tolerance protein CutA [Deltaproteobacteria bacterium]